MCLQFLERNILQVIQLGTRVYTHVCQITKNRSHENSPSLKMVTVWIIPGFLHGGRATRGGGVVSSESAYFFDPSPTKPIMK